MPGNEARYITLTKHVLLVLMFPMLVCCTSYGTKMSKYSICYSNVERIDRRIEVKASLNDSIFSSSYVNHVLDSLRKSNTAFPYLYKNAYNLAYMRMPIVTYSVVNMSRDTITLVDNEGCYCDCAEASCMNCLIADIGTDDGRCEKTFAVLVIDDPLERSDCITMFPGDTICANCRINILMSNNVKSIQPGSYWVQLHISDYPRQCGQDTDILTGHIVSDTLWFRIIK